jgi:peptide/nickel transport system substrate-binding protein
VLFSFACFKNPGVRCDRKRYLFDKIVSAEQLTERVVRFRFERSYFLAASAFDESFTILPSHLYDLSDPDNPAHEPGATADEQAAVVNTSPHNRQWIGLGPYRLTGWTDSALFARRVEGYRGADAWLEVLIWRPIADSQVATNALFEGELDYFDRVSSADFFGQRMRSDEFTLQSYKALAFTPTVSMTVWNTARPELADPRVRTALGMCFDWPRFIDGFYRGLALRVTGEQMPFAGAYDRELAALPFDPAAAKRVLAECGWIDRDGDGKLDKDGAPLSLDYLFPAGNEVSSTFGQAFQAELAKIGVELVLEPRESAALAEALRKRDFDSAALGLALPVQSDPEQLWHSRWAESASANRSGLRDGRVDALIEAIQRETDRARGNALFHQLQRRLYELQPVMFGVAAPRRVAIDRGLRGVQLFALDPGYSLRRWWRP